MAVLNSQYYISKLGLLPHPEGGYYKEFYRAEEIFLKNQLPTRYSGKRNFSTSIYFLLSEDDVSNFHRLQSDELWHFYSGSALIIYILNEHHGLSKIYLGNDLESNENFQVVIKAGNWFAAEVIDKKSYALLGCTVAPGFDFSDFELAKRDTLLDKFQGHKELILRFTRN